MAKVVATRGLTKCATIVARWSLRSVSSACCSEFLALGQLSKIWSTQSILIIFYSMLKLELVIFSCPVSNSSISDLVTAWFFLFLRSYSTEGRSNPLQCFQWYLSHAAPPRWLKTVFRLKSWAISIQLTFFSTLLCDSIYCRKHLQNKLWGP